MPAMLYLYVDDVDATYQRAMSAGADVGAGTGGPVLRRSQRSGVKDACGNVWYIATHIEEVPPAEIRRRAQEVMQKAGGG